MTLLLQRYYLKQKKNLIGPNKRFEGGAYADAIYHTYSTFVSSAKALLLDKAINNSTQAGIIKDFDTNYVATGEIDLDNGINLYRSGIADQ